MTGRVDQPIRVREVRVMPVLVVLGIQGRVAPPTMV